MYNPYKSNTIYVYSRSACESITFVVAGMDASATKAFFHCRAKKFWAWRLTSPVVFPYENDSTQNAGVGVTYRYTDWHLICFTLCCKVRVFVFV